MSLWFVRSRQELSVPLAICSQLQLVSSVVGHGVYTSEKYVFLYDSYVKYGSAGKCMQTFWHFDVNVVMKEFPADRQFIIWWMGLLIGKKQKQKGLVFTAEKGGSYLNIHLENHWNI
jgi:hypothetical protein